MWEKDWLKFLKKIFFLFSISSFEITNLFYIKLTHACDEKYSNNNIV